MRLAQSAIALIIGVSGAHSTLAAATDGSVLILYANRPDLPAVRVFDTAFRSTLSGAHLEKSEIYTEYLDQDRFASEKHLTGFANFIRERYASRNIAIVVAVGLNAYQFLARYRTNLFDGPIRIVRVVFAPDPTQKAPWPADVVDASIQINPLATIQLAQKLQPDVKGVIIVTGAGPWDRAWETWLRRETPSLQGHLTLEFLAGLPTSDLLDRLRKLPRDAIVFSPGYFMDGAGKVFNPGEAMLGITARSSVPVYNPLPLILSNGSVGGVVTTFESVGWRAATIVNLLLQGKSVTEVSNLPLLPGIPVVDGRVMQQWNLDERLLPSNAVIKFGPTTLWDRYWREISTGIVLFGLQTILILGLLVQRRARRRAITALEESERRVGLAARAGKSTMWTWDFSQESPTPNFQSRRRGEPDNIEGQGLAGATIHPIDEELLGSAARRAIEGNAELDVECRILRTDGETRWLAIRGMPEGSGKSRLLGIAFDITDRKNTDLQAASDRTALRHLTRVSLLGQLLASITHELNQPLAAILNNTEAARKLLARDRIDVVELREICEDILAEDHRASSVIAKLRALFKRGDPELQPLRVNDLVRDTLDLMRSELQMRQITVTTELAHDLPPIAGDRVELQQVLLNLIINAADAMEANPTGERTVVIRSFIDPEAERICVVDTGPGVAAAHVKSVFEPFWSTKPRGMGMGLAICKSIVAAHEGSLTLWNNTDGGATFCISLPRRQGEFA